jgi:hypothetical protein
MKLNTELLLFIIFLSINWTGCNSKYQVLNSESQVTNLEKDGCLFVRLHYFPNRIKKLKELGYKKAVVAEQEKIAAANKSMMSAFKKNWNFSPVYFIFPEESKKIKEKRFSEINLLNDNLEIDANITCNCKNALVVEEGRVRRTSTEEYKTDNSKNYGYLFARDTYSADSSQPVQGFIIKDSDFTQLHKPFPFYTRRYRFLFERSNEAMVKELNYNFHHYFKVANK